MYLALKRSTTQGSFFKNNSLTSFHPLLLKALLFSEIASPSSVTPPLPPHPLPSLSCFSFHMLVLFFLIFPLCKKWKAENRMSEDWEGGRGGQERMKGRRQKQRLHIGEIAVCSAEAVLFSALTVTIQSQAPSIYIILWKPNVIHRQCKMVPSPSVERLYTNVMDPQHDKRNSIDQPQAAA